MDYVITFSDVMAGVITLGLGVITFFIKGWFNNLNHCCVMIYWNI